MFAQIKNVNSNEESFIMDYYSHIMNIEPNNIPLSKMRYF